MSIKTTIHLALWILFAALLCRIHAQDAYPAATDRIRLSVANIQIFIMAPQMLKSDKMPKDLIPKFSEDNEWVVGTGFLINHKGGILTAAQVGDDFLHAEEELKKAGIPFQSYISFSARRVDASGVIMSGDSSGIGIAYVGVNEKHDLAVFISATNPEWMGSSVQGKENLRSLTPLEFHVGNPHVGEETFISRFQFDLHRPVPIDTTIDSEESEPLSTPKLHKQSSNFDVYKIDLPGKSSDNGAPLLRTSDEAVLGMVVDTVDGSNFTTVIPTRTILECLDEEKVPYESDRTWVRLKVTVLFILFGLVLSLFFYGAQRRFRLMTQSRLPSPTVAPKSTLPALTCPPNDSKPSERRRR